MTQPGQVRKPGPPTGNEDAPFWMRLVMANAQAYGDFILYCTKALQNCEAQIADFVADGKIDETKVLVGKREAVLELRHIFEAYRKEGEVNDRQTR